VRKRESSGRIPRTHLHIAAPCGSIPPGERRVKGTTRGGNCHEVMMTKRRNPTNREGTGGQLRRTGNYSGLNEMVLLRKNRTQHNCGPIEGSVRNSLGRGRPPQWEKERPNRGGEKFCLYDGPTCNICKSAVTGEKTCGNSRESV